MENQVSEVVPQEAWVQLRDIEDSILVDVRTKAEWAFVGIANLSELGKDSLKQEWMTLPGMKLNPSFIDGLFDQLDGAVPSRIFFMCRSGARSLAAAQLTCETFAAKGQMVECVNVTEGFEGNLDQQNHRGNSNGWKARGLSWRQS